MTELEQKIHYTFQNPELLRTALTHSSYTNEKGGENYERLEFLGDSVLGFVTADVLFHHTPELPEGLMTMLRSKQVCSRGLYSSAQKLNLGEYMILSHGEEKSGGRMRKSILEDMMESLIAAIYLDAGIEEAGRFIREYVLADIDFNVTDTAADNKSRLQELLQKNGSADIRYEEVSESGPDHDKSFVCRVLHDGTEIGRGSGKTKKEAQQAAAGEALRKSESGEI